MLILYINACRLAENSMIISKSSKIIRRIIFSLRGKRARRIGHNSMGPRIIWCGFQIQLVFCISRKFIELKGLI